MKHKACIGVCKGKSRSASGFRLKLEGSGLSSDVKAFLKFRGSCSNGMQVIKGSDIHYRDPAARVCSQSQTQSRLHR